LICGGSKRPKKARKKENKITKPGPSINRQAYKKEKPEALMGYRYSSKVRPQLGQPVK